MKKLFLGTLVLLSVVATSTTALKAQELKDNTITLTGRGTASAQPDMASLSINISFTTSTLKDSKTKVERSLKQVLSVLQREQVEDKDIKTTWLNYDTEYNYKDGKRVKVGQRASQSLQINVRNLGNSTEKLANILDKIVDIPNVKISSIDFSLDNKTSIYKKSRELAFNNAYERAKQYAELAGRHLGKVIAISETSSDEISRSRYNVRPLAAKTFAAAPEDFSVQDNLSTIPAGEEEVSSEVTIVFSLD